MKIKCEVISLIDRLLSCVIGSLTWKLCVEELKNKWGFSDWNILAFYKGELEFNADNAELISEEERRER